MTFLGVREGFIKGALRNVCVVMEGSRLFTLYSVSNVTLPLLSVSGEALRRGTREMCTRSHPFGLCRLATERHGGGLTFHVTLQSAHIWPMKDEIDTCKLLQIVT